MNCTPSLVGHFLESTIPIPGRKNLGGALVSCWPFAKGVLELFERQGHSSCRFLRRLWELKPSHVHEHYQHDLLYCYLFHSTIRYTRNLWLRLYTLSFLSLSLFQPSFLSSFLLLYIFLKAAAFAVFYRLHRFSFAWCARPHTKNRCNS